jgi:hypothetical protein
MTSRKPRRWVKLFMYSFVPKLRSGAKPTTIRPLPKRTQDWPQVGDIIDARHWFAKPYRSPQMAILTARIIRVTRVRVSEDGIRLAVPNEGPDASWFEYHRRGHDRLEAIAKADGFDSWDHMAKWFEWTHGLPFEGILIEWDPTTISRGTARAEGLGSSPTPDLATGVGEAKSPAGNDALVAELRSEIARLTRENAELEAELTAITREPAEVRCQELAAMLGESGRRNHRLIDRRAELMGAGRALDEALRKLGYLDTPSQLEWRRVLRKKPSDCQPKQPQTPTH